MSSLYLVAGGLSSLALVTVTPPGNQSQSPPGGEQQKLPSKLASEESW